MHTASYKIRGNNRIFSHLENLRKTSIPNSSQMTKGRISQKHQTTSVRNSLANTRAAPETSSEASSARIATLGRLLSRQEEPKASLTYPYIYYTQAKHSRRRKQRATDNRPLCQREWRNRFSEWTNWQMRRDNDWRKVVAHAFLGNSSEFVVFFFGLEVRCWWRLRGMWMGKQSSLRQTNFFRALLIFRVGSEVRRMLVSVSDCWNSWCLRKFHYIYSKNSTLQD